MSRTYRKRRESFEARLKSGWYDWDMGLNGHLSSWRSGRNWTVKRCKAEYLYGENYQHSLPRDFRNSVNRQRRARDKQELHREINARVIGDYVGNYDPWNCKTSNSWGYW